MLLSCFCLQSFLKPEKIWPKTMATKTLKARVRTRIAKKRGDVLLPKDFRDLGGETQVLRTLRTLTLEKEIVRLGYGVYAKATVSSISGRSMLRSKSGFQGVAREALDRLGVAWEPTEAQQAYNEGRSTQIPLNPAVKVKGRFTRQLRFGPSELRIES